MARKKKINSKMSSFFKFHFYLFYFIISVHVCKHTCVHTEIKGQPSGVAHSFQSGFQGLNSGHCWPEMSVFVSCVKEACQKNFPIEKSLFGIRDQLPNCIWNFIWLNVLNPGCKVKNSLNNLFFFFFLKGVSGARLGGTHL